jgi:hypothetical protein
MPNWVYNNVSVSGKREDLIAFANKARQEHETQWISTEWKHNEDGTTTRIPAEERTIEIEMSGKQPLSFWNFVRPTDEELPYYFGHKVKDEDKDDPDATSEERLAKSLTFSGSGWYDWNVRNWGTKWDANDDNGDEPDLDDLKEHDSVSYSFSTAWSIPEPVFRAMVAQHPELDFEFHSEEEQGWGAEYSTYDSEDEDGKPIKELRLDSEWDIPNCHADYVNRDNIDGCVCNWGEDEDDWFEDCPRPEQDFFVVVSKTYKITAKDAETAWELAVSGEDGSLEEVGDEITAIVKDEDGRKIYPIADTGKVE